ncbi:hypothetical protein BKA93DRAFT_768236 [Sparassis latifolia]|uniref:LsmAD domain-containing protein n=1 Tax=Sparassis crispa TaxID=139825 RepID=A0A401H1S6_9APHY|nr:predicted protein [Sparassis crispa]GBE88385.1 predicted protein [Sparassis crispa]
MATTARQPKPNRKGPPEPANRVRAPAWSSPGPRASPTFSPGATPVRLPNGPQSASPAAFPPLGHANGAPSPAPTRPDKDDRVLAQLSGLTGTTITLSTKTNVRYEGSVLSTNAEGDTTGVTLRDVKDLTVPGAPLRDTLFIAATNIDQWSSGPADAKLTNGDTFKTDTDISQKTGRRERELQAWQPHPDDPSAPSASASTSNSAAPPARTTDDETFGSGSQGASWDQFAVNERLFGVRAQFDEEAYTTRLDRSAPDFKERERQAAKIASEILSSSTSNTHIAEERTQNFVGVAEGANEEDKYGAVVRSANAYVPPGARKGPLPSTNGTAKSPPDIPKVAVNAPDGSAVPAAEKEAGSAQPAADAVPAFRDFVSSEKDRLMKKKQALMKNEMDKRLADLVKFSQNFKLNKPIPDDLVPILAKDEDKQRQIREKSTKDAESSHARAIGATTLTTTASPTVARAVPSAAAAGPATAKVAPELTRQALSKSGTIPPAAQKNATVPSKPGEPPKGRISMVIQSIPPFRGKRVSTAGHSATSSSTQGAARASLNTNVAAQQGGHSPLSPGAANRLNVNASSFRPNVKQFSPPGGSPRLNGTPSSSASPKTKPADSASSVSPVPAPPNPFFGTRTIKKTPPVHIKDDFNPFKHGKVPDAKQVPWTWPYTGKRYMQLFPPPQMQPQPQSPHMQHPGPPQPPPQPTYEEESAAQAATRGYVYAYPPYGYPQQMQMIPGMGPPPPGAYIPGPPAFMQPMAYPMPPPNAMYPSTPMGQMQPYGMPPPPPGAYPPPNGAGPRPSMPPTPIPSHAHPYYHQSPQLQHAVPYQMMMPPPGPHGYDQAQAPPVQMGGHA